MRGRTKDEVGKQHLKSSGCAAAVAGLLAGSLVASSANGLLGFAAGLPERNAIATTYTRTFLLLCQGPNACAFRFARVCVCVLSLLHGVDYIRK